MDLKNISNYLYLYIDDRKKKDFWVEKYIINSFYINLT